MIPFNEIKVGDYVYAEYEGQQRMGMVTRINRDEKQVGVETDVQEFFYSIDHLFPVPLSDESLSTLRFQRERAEDGRIKYRKGAFRIVTPSAGDFSTIEMWYREDRRHHPNVHFIHQLQNHYHDMTKVHLTDEVIS